MPRKAADPVNFARYRLGQALKYTDKGRPRSDLFNIAAILEQDDRWAGTLGWNDMAKQVIKLKAPPYAGAIVGAWSDVDEIRTAIWLTDAYDVAPAVPDVRRAVLSVAQRRMFHPVRDYLEALAWDGTPRVLEWAYRYLGASDAGETGDYNWRAAQKWLVSAVARVMRPGCKADNVLILEGPQGRLKSSALAALAGEWFMDTPFNLHDKDRFTHIQGKWIIELAELDGFSRAESSAAKAFFSSPRDRYTPKYIAHAIDVDRQCIFAGTVNLGTYLHDKTGNRRYWPIRVGIIDLDALRAARDQLWAEAVQLYRDGTRWWVEQHEVALFAVEQEARETPDALEELLRTWCRDQDAVSMRTILETWISLPVKDWTPALQTRIGQIMSSLGWEVHRVRNGSRRERIYRRGPEADPKAMPLAVKERA
jgi:putative DNA primase/helicase